MDKLLRQFLQVATCKNLSLAARQLCLSQPTLSHNMRRLEESLGLELFLRTSTGIRLTEYGEILLEQASIMQRVYDNTLQKLEEAKARSGRGLRIGTGHAWWQPLLRQVFDLYRQAHPSASLSVDFGNHLRLLDLLLSNDIDLFVGHEIVGLARGVELLFEPLFQSSDEVFVRHDHPLRHTLCSTDDLLNYPTLLITPDENRFVHLVEESQPKNQHKLLHASEKIHYITNSLMAGVDIVNSTHAILPFPRSMTSYFRQYEIYPLSMPEPYNRGAVGVYLPREKLDDPQVMQVMSLIRQQVHQQAELIATY